ncbi:unnamed protein product [Lymnaea stagnalis]|uniref:Zinc finger CCHC domain-containing protein 4 n=1 Tax=Lymnaea stagnalis TaxID=6523 RepID=A0AAV2GXY2_LYMST
MKKVNFRESKPGLNSPYDHKMAAKQANIELIPLGKDILSPACQHGPTLLFERWDKSTSQNRQFFACSAFRDRKQCQFFQWADQKSSNASLNIEGNGFSHKDLRNRYFQFKKLPRSSRSVCCTCGRLLLEGELSDHAKKGHLLKHKVGLKDVKQPSFLFKPLDDNKTFAQYLFSKTTVDFLMETFESLGFTHVLCVGTPRIHEAVQNGKRSGNMSMSSMLLDLDERYAQIYPPALFTKYNMFNHHFFEPNGKVKISKFLNEGKEHTILVTDPPFGGLIEALASSFTKISSMLKELHPDGNPSMEKGFLLPMILFFPYFMEKRILQNLSTLSMIDYKVDYDNHNLFNSQQKKKGSPVRMFTNISQVLFRLPAEEGYWFCQSCQKYSSKENWHCKDCRACTSKDGTTYVHCDACLRCVKPSRSHCFKCGVCQLKDHVCGQQVLLGCHICGELDHKRRDCPARTTNGESLKTIRLGKRKQNQKCGIRAKKQGTMSNV